MGLAIRTHIPYSAWLADGDDALVTALRLIHEADQAEDRERKRWEARQKTK